MPKFIDYTNKKIGRVLIQSFQKTKSNHSHWNCKCDCGNSFISNYLNFKRGEKFECKECVLERRRGIDLTGRKFGRWTVLSRSLDSRNKTVWHVLCDCGTEGYVATCVLGKKEEV